MRSNSTHPLLRMLDAIRQTGAAAQEITSRRSPVSIWDG